MIDLLDLPDEVLMRLVMHLPFTIAFLAARATCKFMYNLIDASGV